jgi:hypothetical protein
VAWPARPGLYNGLPYFFSLEVQAYHTETYSTSGLARNTLHCSAGRIEPWCEYSQHTVPQRPGRRTSGSGSAAARSLRLNLRLGLGVLRLMGGPAGAGGPGPGMLRLSPLTLTPSAPGLGASCAVFLVHYEPLTRTRQLQIIGSRYPRCGGPGPPPAAVGPSRLPF